MSLGQRIAQTLDELFRAIKFLAAALVMGLGISLASADVVQNITTRLASVVTYSVSTTQIVADTADGSDSKDICISGGGGTCGDRTRGASVEPNGNENGDNGSLYLVAGNTASSDVHVTPQRNLLIRNGGSTKWTFQSDGTIIGSGTADLGWAVVDGADDTACTTTCTAPAVFGFNLAAGATAPVLVGPTDATADICFCAGAS